MEVLIKPLVTEKMTDLSEKANRYGFVVSSPIRILIDFQSYFLDRFDLFNHNGNRNRWNRNGCDA